MQKGKKSKTNSSTMHMSNNVSTRTAIFNDEQKKLYYTTLPIKKDVPSWNQSASTWRHSSVRYSFSKSQRFKDSKPNYLDLLQPQIPSTRTNKTCSFGKGNKQPMSTIILKNAKEKPSPDAYFMEKFIQNSRIPSKGKTFGLGWKNYQKVYIQHRKDPYSSHFSKDNPSAKYQVRQKPGKNQRAYSAYTRLKMYTQKMTERTKHVPGSHHQIKDRHLYSTIGLNERNFSFGERIDLSSPANDYPGPQYQIQGFCDKFQNTKEKNIGKQ